MSVYYVSTKSAHGVAAGSAKGDGSKAHPFSSIEQALAVEKNGDVIRLNGVFHDSFTLRHGVAIEPVAKGSAVIDGTVTIAVQGAEKVTIGAVKIDAKGATDAVMLDTEGRAYSVIMAGTRLAGASGYAIAGQDRVKVNLTTSGVNFTAVDSRGLVGLTSLAKGNIDISGGHVAISHVLTGKEEQGSNQVGAGLIGQVEAISSQVTVRVDGVTAKGNINPQDHSVAGLQVMNVAKASIENNSITLTGFSNKPLRGISVTYDFLHPINSSGGVIKGNTVIDNDPGEGVLYYIGTNGTVGPKGFADDETVFGNVGIGNATAAKKNDLHGVLVGYQSGAHVLDNQMTDTALAYAMKDDFGSSLVKGNANFDAATTVWYNKGSQGVEWIDNDSAQSGSYHPVALYVGPDLDEPDGDDYESSVALVEGNTVDGIIRHGAVITKGSVVTFLGGKVIDGPVTLNAGDFANEQAPAAAAAVMRFAQAAAMIAPSAAANLPHGLGAAPNGSLQPFLATTSQTPLSSGKAGRSLVS